MSESNFVDKKFYIVGIVLGIFSLITSIVIPALGLVLGIIGWVLNIKNKEKYRVNIGLALNVAGVIISVLYIFILVWTGIIM